VPTIAGESLDEHLVGQDVQLLLLLPLLDHKPKHQQQGGTAKRKVLHVIKGRPSARSLAWTLVSPAYPMSFASPACATTHHQGFSTGQAEKTEAWYSS
jgi:hypothetical protein